MNNNIKVNVKSHEIILFSKGSYDVDQLTFKKKRGSFLEGKKIELTLHTIVDVEGKMISFNESEINAEGEVYGMRGMLALNSPAQLTLEFSSSAASLEKVKRLLTTRIAANLSKIKLKERAAGSAKIFVVLAPNNQPEVEVNFEVKSSVIGYNEWEGYANLIKGSYNNHDDSTREIGDENSRITFSEFQGSYLTIPVKGAGYIKNISDPFLHVAGTSKGSVNILNRFLNPEKMEFDGGKFKLDFTMEGMLFQLSQKKTFRSGNNSFLLKGQVSGANFSYFPRDLEFNSISGNFYCDWNNLHIKELKLLINKNKIGLNGEVTNLTSFLLTEGEKVKGDFHVSSPGIVFDHFSFKKEKVAQKRKKREIMHDVVAKMDKLIDVIELNLNFKTPRFAYRKFEAQDIHGVLTAINSDFILNNFSFKSSRGIYVFIGLSTYCKTQKRTYPSKMSHFLWVGLWFFTTQEPQSYYIDIILAPILSRLSLVIRIPF